MSSRAVEERHRPLEGARVVAGETGQTAPACLVESLRPLARNSIIRPSVNFGSDPVTPCVGVREVGEIECFGNEHLRQATGFEIRMVDGSRASEDLEPSSDGCFRQVAGAVWRGEVVASSVRIRT